jgi:hypothetical protein
LWSVSRHGLSATTRRPNRQWVAFGSNAGQRPVRHSTTDGGWALLSVQVYSFCSSWQFYWVWLERCGMSTSSVACSICGETRDDLAVISGGCVACNPFISSAASKPEIPVSPGPPRVDGIGCLQHREVDCERCGLLETRHRLVFDPHQQDETTGSWSRKDPMGPAYLTVGALFLVLLGLVALCGWIVWINFPR